MRLLAYSVRDSKGEVFSPPFYQKTHGEAERSFNKLVHDDKSMVCQYPDDFDLYHVGEFDDQTGVFKSLESPQHITKAVMMISKRNEAVALNS